MDFFKRPQFTEAVISPDGRYLAVTYPEGATTPVLVMDLKTRKFVSKTGFGNRRHGYRLHWVNDRRLLVRVGVKTGSFDRLIDTGRIYAFDYNGKARKEVPQVKSGHKYEPGLGYAVVAWMPSDPLHVLVKSVRRQSPVLYKMNVETGRLKRVAVAPETDTPVDYVIDEDGRLWFATTMDSEGHRKHYRYNEKTQSYQPIVFQKLRADDVNLIAPLDEQHVWVASDHGRKTRGLALLDLTQEKLEFKAANDIVDLMDVLPSLDGRRIVGAAFMPDYPIHQYWDRADEDVKLLAALDNAFKGQKVRITSTTRDKTKAIVLVSSDRQPEMFFLWHIREMRVEPVAATRPWIQPETMAEMKPIRFTARDGLTLHGYLTLPPGVPAKKLPMIVHPHGGPHGVRDQWAFDPEVQMLANRGYAVLQVNFRGSGGYGKAFEEKLGYRHWGTSMQDDVTDATLWAIREGIADPDRICIYGASYGGYAALMGVVKEPDLYRCAVGYVGVYSLPLMYEDGDIPRSEFGRNYLTKAIGTDMKELRQRSPAFQADKIRAAVMLVQGGKDERVPPSQAEAMRDALEKAGKSYEWFYSSYSAHGIVDPKTNVELYRKMLSFFQKHIGPGKTPR